MQEMRLQMVAQTENPKNVQEEASSTVKTISIKHQINLNMTVYQSISSVPLDRDGLLLLTDVQSTL